VKRQSDTPYFLYYSPTLPHAEYEVPDTAPYSGRDWPAIERTYAAMVTRADRYIGAVLDALGDDENTVVFVTSDNGAPTSAEHKAEFFRSNGPLRGVKGQLYEGGVRIPMLVRWPGKVRAGSVSDLPWSFVDFLPTAATLAGATPPDGLDGVSMVDAFRSGATSRDRAARFLYWEFYGFDAQESELRANTLAQAARWGEWKAVRRPGAAMELYNLKTDVSESTDVASTNPELAAKMQAYLDSAHVEPRPHNTGSMEFVQ